MTRDERSDLIDKLALEDLNRVDIHVLRDFFYKKRREYYHEFDDDELIEMLGDTEVNNV